MIKKRHHIVPTSIGGPPETFENIYWWTEAEHEAYHQLFRNHPPSIVIKIIEGWTDKKDNLNLKLMSFRDYESWKKVFGDKKPAEAIEFIKKNFLPAEEKYLKSEFKKENLPFKKGRKRKRA